MSDSTIAVPTHPHLPVSLPFAKGQEEPGGEMVPPCKGNRRRGLSAAAMFMCCSELQRKPTLVKGSNGETKDTRFRVDKGVSWALSV